MKMVSAVNGDVFEGFGLFVGFAELVGLQRRHIAAVQAVEPAADHHRQIERAAAVVDAPAQVRRVAGGEIEHLRLKRRGEIVVHQERQPGRHAAFYVCFKRGRVGEAGAEFYMSDAKANGVVDNAGNAPRLDAPDET